MNNQILMVLLVFDRCVVYIILKFLSTKYIHINSRKEPVKLIANSVGMNAFVKTS